MAHKHSLPGELTIYAVGQNRSLFQGWIAKLPKGRRGAALEGSALPVDSSGVNEADAAGVQLLLSLSKSLAAHKRTLQLDNPSRPLAAALETLGLSGLLTSDSTAGASA
jgi:anti-anti-sigma regulatory factor